MEKLYAVGFRKEVEEMTSDPGYFSYDDRAEHEGFYYTPGKDCEDAGRRFLSYIYNEIPADDRAYVFDNAMTSFFIPNIIYGDRTLTGYKHQSKIKELENAIDDYFVESRFMEGKVSMYKVGDKISSRINISFDDDEENMYIEKIYNKFPTKCLLDILDEKEKKEFYIEANLGDLCVIPLRKLLES